MKKTINIVILGAGFGGIQCALALEKLITGAGLKNTRITLVDKNRYHTFIPALYEVASASPKVSEDTLYRRVNTLIKHILLGRQIEFIKAFVSQINLKKRYITFSDGGGVDFDYLVIALGSKTNFYNISGLKDYALDLKDFISALNIHRAIKLDDEIPERIVIGGGGLTGVELAAEIDTCLKETCPSITIIEGGKRMLPSFSERIANIANQRLKNLGIKTKLGVPIKEVIKGYVILANGKRVSFDRLFWTGGIMPNPLIETLPLQKEKGFLTVSSYLQTLNIDGSANKQVFALGDVCVVHDNKGELVPWTAQKANSEGRQIAQNIYRKLLNQENDIYQPAHARFIIPIGGKWAIEKLKTIVFQGFWAWVLKDLAELRYLSSILPWPTAVARWLAAMVTFSRND